MMYELWLYRQNSDTYDMEWVSWQKGSLDDCLEEFFFQKAHIDSYTMKGLRLEWKALDV